MSSRHVRLLPVVDEHGKLTGAVSRRDLLTVFPRPDEDIAADVRQVLDEILLAGPGEADVTVRDGIVTLTGAPDPATGAPGGPHPRRGPADAGRRRRRRRHRPARPARPASRGHTARASQLSGPEGPDQSCCSRRSCMPQGFFSRWHPRPGRDSAPAWTTPRLTPNGCTGSGRTSRRPARSTTLHGTLCPAGGLADSQGLEVKAGDVR